MVDRALWPAGLSPTSGSLPWLLWGGTVAQRWRGKPGAAHVRRVCVVGAKPRLTIKTMTTKHHVGLFESVQVRSHWCASEEKWYFSVVDVVQVLTDSTIPKRYWSGLRRKLKKESGQPYEKIVRLKMPAADGRLRETDAADVQTLLRLIQSIPPSRALQAVAGQGGLRAHARNY